MLKQCKPVGVLTLLLALRLDVPPLAPPAPPRRQR